MRTLIPSRTHLLSVILRVNIRRSLIERLSENMEAGLRNIIINWGLKIQSNKLGESDDRA